MTIEMLEQKGIEAARNAAIDFVIAQGAKDTVDLDRLVDLLKAAIPTAIEEARRDALEALEANMGGFAVPTFLATMRVAGINAAKEALAA